MDQAGLLTRIAIDESHCCSQMGHDFRPDYKKLSQLRSFFPDVPIVALTATCGKEVLTDVVRILGLKGCTPGASAEPNRTVFFSAPLYRANLHYSVVKKPSSAAAVITMMVEEILTKHADDTGIVYCLSKADTEAVAKGLREASEGKVKTGTYHAGMEDWEKQRIHKDWRRGKIKVVCATIAFGSKCKAGSLATKLSFATVGIDAPDGKSRARPFSISWLTCNTSPLCLPSFRVEEHGRLVRIQTVPRGRRGLTASPATRRPGGREETAKTQIACSVNAFCSFAKGVMPD